MTDPLHEILVENTSASRKMAPVWKGFVRYFPNGMKAVAYLSKLGNDKHNPDGLAKGWWSWNRSDDHGDCIVRHQSEVGIVDEFDLPHELAVAWRAMAQLERYLVDTYDLELPPAAYMVPDEDDAVVQDAIDDTFGFDHRGLYPSPPPFCVPGVAPLGRPSLIVLDDIEVDESPTDYSFWLGEDSP